MKKLLYFSAFALIILGTSSCEKIQDALFKPFESPINFEITIPVITNTTSETSMGQTSVQYNLDSVIKKNTGDVFDADVIGSMYINQIAIQLSDSDGNNNLGNFDNVKLSVSANGSPAVLGPFNVPVGSTTSAAFPVSNSPDIRPYFNGSAVNFMLNGKANKITNKPLRARISATVRFEK